MEQRYQAVLAVIADGRGVGEVALQSQLDYLSAHGHTPIYLASVPHLLGSGTENAFSCSRLDALTPAGCKRSAISTVTLNRAQGGYNSRLGLLSARGAFELWDLTPYVCPGAVCVDHADGRSYFRDSTHISVSQSSRMSSVFSRLIQAVPLEKAVRAPAPVGP